MSLPQCSTPHVCTHRWRWILFSASVAWPAFELTPELGSGDVKGTLSDTLGYHLVLSDVRRHRLISISYVTLLPCHGRGRGFESRRPRHLPNGDSRFPQFE